MKICFILGHFYPHVGGGEKMMFGLIKGIIAQGHDVRVVTSNSGGIVGYQEYQGINVFYYPWYFLFGHPIPKPTDLRQHVEWADVVHTCQQTVAVSSLRVGQKLNKPVVVTIFEIINNKWFWIEKNPLKALLFKLYETYVATRKYTYWHTISDATNNDLKELNIINHVKKIYPPVDFDEYKVTVQHGYKYDLHKYFDVNPNHEIFLFYGRPGQTKGIFVYLDAINSLVRKYGKSLLDKSRFCFVMANDPILQKNRFIETVIKNDLAEYVKVVDSVDRETLTGFIKQADYIVIPSITEGFGYSAVEACYHEKKVICSDGGSLPEVVFGECLFFRNRDSNDLCEKLRAVILREDCFTHLPYKEYKLEEIVKQLEQLYLDMQEQ